MYPFYWFVKVEIRWFVIDSFYNQFEKAIKKGNFNLECIKKIINIYFKSIEEKSAVLINSSTFDIQSNEDLEISVLKTIAMGNGKLII
jgi:hypothetical protein